MKRGNVLLQENIIEIIVLIALQFMKHIVKMMNVKESKSIVLLDINVVMESV